MLLFINAPTRFGLKGWPSSGSTKIFLVIVAYASTVIVGILHMTTTAIMRIKCYKLQYGLVLRRGHILEYLVVNRIVVKRVLFEWFKLG
jgi:hypothetical protein